MPFVPAPMSMSNFHSLHFTSRALSRGGVGVRIRRLQKFLSSASSGTTRSSRMSWSTISPHLPLGLPLSRLPGISMSITCLRLLSCSLRCTCPNHLSLLSLALFFILPTPSSFLISSLFILSFSVTPLILLSIIISVFSRIWINEVYLILSYLKGIGRYINRLHYIYIYIYIKLGYLQQHKKKECSTMNSFNMND